LTEETRERGEIESQVREIEREGESEKEKSKTGYK
jgi:hypothetical protein